MLLVMKESFQYSTEDRLASHPGAVTILLLVASCCRNCVKLQDPVVRKPINTNPRLKLTEVFISLVKKCF